MHLSKLLFITLTIIALGLSACDWVSSGQAPTTEPDLPLSAIETETINSTYTAQPDLSSTSTSTPEIDFYAECGSGGLIDVLYYFKDSYGNISPTQVKRFKKTSDDVRDYVEVITCLKYDEGWISNPDEVENGYENEIIFFDKNGVAHSYRIIIGGHYVAPYDPSHKDITGSLNGVDNLYFNVQEWIDATREQFESMGSRQIGVSIYLDDNQGDLSKVLTQVYSFRETNLQIAEALKKGEGYPDQVPDEFFLFATDSWLVQPD